MQKLYFLFNAFTLSIFTSYAGSQGIFITSVENDTVCAGDVIDITYYCSSLTPTGTLSVELSDASGSFASPVVIATEPGVTSGTISTAIPSESLGGSGYRVRITSSAPAFTGTPNTDNIVINAIPHPVIIPTGNIEICEGDTVALCVQGSFTSIFWTTGSANVQCVLVYQSNCMQALVQDNNGCMGISDTVCVIVNYLPNAHIGFVSDNNVCEGGCDTLFGIDNIFLGNSFLWSTGSTDISILACDEGIYSLTVTDNATGCTASSSDTIDCTNSINELAEEDFTLYPNPATTTLTLNTDFKNAQLNILNAQGQLVFHSTFDVHLASGETAFDISSLSSGIYFLNLTDGTQVVSKKFVKE